MKDITKKDASRAFWYAIAIMFGIVYLALALGKLTVTFVDPNDYISPQGGTPTPTYHLAPRVYEIPTELFDRFRRSYDSEIQELKDKVAVLEQENRMLMRASAEVVATYEKTQRRVNNNYDKVIAAYEKKVRELKSVTLDKPIKVIKKGESYWKVTYDIYTDNTIPHDGRVEFYYNRRRLPDHLKNPITTVVIEVKTSDDIQQALVQYLKQIEMHDANIAYRVDLTKFIK